MIEQIKHSSLSIKLRTLITAMILILAIVIIIFIFLLLNNTKEYNKIIRNLVTVSEFNFDFKTNLDYKMYQFVVGPGTNFDQLDPISDIRDARNLVTRLKVTTVNQDSMDRLNYINNFLNNLERYIYDIRDHREYDANIQRLEFNVYILTELIQDKVSEYIYYETNELAQISVQVSASIRNTIILASIGAFLLIALIWFTSVKITDSITKPIRELCENIRLVGAGDFTVRPINANDDEIQTLTVTFDSMVQQISELMEDYREEQVNLRTTELKLLQAQINPHFLYNTFDTIIWLAEDHRDQQVVDMVTSLSNFFRAGLSQGEDFIPLKEEELHVRSYLEIQQVRYRDILEYQIEIPENLYTYTVPKLTLQPLVENALYHGIKNRRQKGLIRVTASAEGKTLCLQVIDSGIGMQPDVLEKLRQQVENSNPSGSFGLYNVQQRIRLYYGEGYGLDIQSEYEKGTTVSITLPLKNEPKSD